MNVNYINAVCRAAKSIMHDHFGIQVAPNKPTAGKGIVPSNEVSVVLGVNGELSGQIICTLNTATAKQIVGSMMGGMKVETLDEMGWSAIQEFGNWVAGSTATELSKENCIIDVTPPVINDGLSKYRSSKTFISVPMDSSIGEINIHISLVEKAS